MTKKRLRLDQIRDEIKNKALLDEITPITFEIMYKGELCEIDSFIKPAPYSVTHQRYTEISNNRDAMAPVIAARICDENGKVLFTVKDVRQFFNDHLTDAIWQKIWEVDHPKPKVPEEMTNSGTSLSLPELEAEPLQKPSTDLDTQNSSAGNNTEPSAEASIPASE